MCEHIKHDPLFADQFFFQELNDWQNAENGTFRPLYDFQGLIDQEIDNNNFIWIQGSRGSAKTYQVARSIVKLCLRYQNQKVIITAPSFRQSRQMFDYCVAILKAEFGVDSHTYKLEQEIDIDNDVKRGHEVLAIFKTNSTIEALPMGSGDTVRGKRATVLVCDEFYLFQKALYEAHVLPFLNVQIGENKAKVIYMTTSYYQDCYAYEVLMNIAGHIKRGDPGYSIIDLEIDQITYSTRVPAEDEPEDYKQPHFPASVEVILHQLDSMQNKVTEQLSDTALMTFYNIWIKSSANFFKTDVIRGLQVDKIPVLAKRPEKSTVPFVLGVDPAGMGVDSTTMGVISCPGENKRHLHAVYKWDKIKPEEIAGYIHQMVDRYGMNIIVMDKTGAMGAIVADACGNPQQLINGVMEARIPILPHDHPEAHKARAHIVLTKPSDPKMQTGVFNEQYGGQIQGEADLKNAFMISMKAVMENGSFLAPNTIDAAEYRTADVMQSSVGEIMDNIREAFGQFPRIDRKQVVDVSSPGKTVVKTDSKGNWQFTRSARDDGAFCIIYANWAANIHYKQSAKTQNTAPVVVWSEGPDQSRNSPYSQTGHRVDRPKLY